MAVIIFLVSTFDSFPKNEVNIFPINHIQDAYFRGYSRMEWKEGGKICHAYPTIMKLATVIPYLKEVQQLYKSRVTPLEFC